ncbi:hypothetical protein EYC84_003584 [Monilinia fructicola]|uniref:Uncharacterized protein n=1 Tax=Monilinia fructicola TaxID=38448 RepID=A0A5M9JYT0_MONFR|nr:hypothetical protein EYC84_003584 [Monilinia fructicola]
MYSIQGTQCYGTIREKRREENSMLQVERAPTTYFVQYSTVHLYLLYPFYFNLPFLLHTTTLKNFQQPPPQRVNQQRLDRQERARQVNSTLLYSTLLNSKQDKANKSINKTTPSLGISTRFSEFYSNHSFITLVAALVTFVLSRTSLHLCPYSTSIPSLIDTVVCMTSILHNDPLNENSKQ